jgi:hypothetical protein
MRDDNTDEPIDGDIMADSTHYIDPSLFDTDRPRGVLSTTDREYLTGQQEYEHQQTESNRKQEIRKRVTNSFHDFPILTAYLDKDQRERVFEELNETKLENDLSSFVSFIYKGLNGDIERLQEIIRRGLFDGISIDEDGALAADIKSISVNIDVEYEPDVDEVYQRFREGGDAQLMPEEIGLLVRKGKITAEDLERLDRSDPMDVPPKLERNMNQMKEMAEEMDGVELVDESPKEDE